jgi:hypothetical protein
MSRGMKKNRSKCKEPQAANYSDKKKAGCDHHDHPISMMALGGKYQARCSGCQTAGPVVEEGPWAAQQALYSTRARAGEGIARGVRVPITQEKGLRGVGRGAWCDHDYPIEVHIYGKGRRRARCLRCQAIGPLRGDADGARRALLGQERAKR